MSLFVPFGGGVGVTAGNLNRAFTSVAPSIAYKTSSESRTSNTTPSADSHLTLPLEANAGYIGHFLLFYTGTDASDLKYSLSVPTGSTGFHVPMGMDTASTSSAAASLNVNGTSTFTTVKAIGTDASFTVAAFIHVSIQTSVTAGNVTLLWSQNTSDTTATQIFAGSSLQLYRAY